MTRSKSRLAFVPRCTCLLLRKADRLPRKSFLRFLGPESKPCGFTFSWSETLARTTQSQRGGFRGFVLADRRVPFIVINDQDAKTARSFTLIHELVHIYLWESAISGAPAHAERSGTAAKVEQFCNEAASYVLLPASFQTARPAALQSFDAAAAQLYITQTARTWAVSEPLVAFRLRRLGWISPTLYQQLSNAHAQRWIDPKGGFEGEEPS